LVTNINYFKIIDFVIPSKESTPLKAYSLWREWADPKVI
jgi:hypothetical protein